MFPQLQDHDLIICTDWTLIQLSNEIQKTLDIDVGCNNFSSASIPTDTIDEVEEDADVLNNEDIYKVYSSLTNGCEKKILSCQPLIEPTNNNSDQSDNQNLQNETVQNVRGASKKRKSNSDSTMPCKKAFKSSDETCDNNETKFSKAKRKIKDCILAFHFHAPEMNWLDFISFSCT